MSSSQPSGEKWSGTRHQFAWNHIFKTYAPKRHARYIEWMEMELFDEKQELDYKTQELVVIAIDAVINWPAPFIDAHMHGAFDHGATQQEIADTIIAAGQAMGPHTMNHGFVSLERVVKDREERGWACPRNRADLETS